jgi:asparagine synthase (glutamine-hydrolysing)
MCGILGQIKFNNRGLWNTSRFRSALDMIRHRGPDDYGMMVDDDFIFGHRRLSIIDLDSHAKQPMVSSDGNVILVFNGEIYNYKELRNSLVLKGYTFNTESDTEVLLYSYYEHGISCINDFIGMFAFSIFDHRTGKSYLVRDRLGVKPLYYHQVDGVFTFSSEIKSILYFLNLKKDLNIDAVSSYLSFRYPILNDTFFNDVFSLEPAHYIEICSNEYNIVEYWSPVKKFKKQRVDMGEIYYINKLQSLLKSAVKYRMISDVPFGSFLSGGVDSSIITSIMSIESKDRIKTYTVGFDEEGCNEFEYATVIADKYSTDHTEITLCADSYISNLEKLISYKDAPLSVPNEVPLYLMSLELKKHISVVLSGEGADEIFGGYGRIFRSPYDLERINNIDNLQLSNDEKETLCDEFIKKYGVEVFNNEIDHFHSVYSYTSLPQKIELLSSSIDVESIEQKLISKFKSFFDELDDDSYYNKMMYVFEKIHLLGLLHRLDTSTMAASVEARVPFVDHRIVEFAFTVPLKYKLKWNGIQENSKSKTLMSDKLSEVYDTPKYILKKAFESIIPSEILFRKKVGFPVPLNKWFGGDFNDYAKSILLSSVAINRGLYNNKNIETLLNDEISLKNHRSSMILWMLINLELFNRQYIDEKGASI